jgi:hypothetical protein
MQNVSTKYLDIGDVEVSDTVNDDITSIVFLSASLSIETSAVKNQAEDCILWQVRGCLNEGLLMVDRLDMCSDVSVHFTCLVLESGRMAD